MKRHTLIFTILLVIIIATFCSGFSYTKNIGNVRLLHQDEEILNQEFAIATSKYLEIRLFHNGSLRSHYKKVGKDNPIGYLSSLNPQLMSKIDELAAGINKEKEEPYYKYKGDGKFDYFEGKQGQAVDVNALAMLIINSLSKNTVLSLPIRYLETETSYADLVSRTQKIANFATYYKTSSAGRKNNIKVAASRLNGACILPQETLSFNETVGNRTLENGFLRAKIIQNGEFIDGIGGGVCQVSTTLFNVCLLAGLEIEKSSTHSLPVSYVPPSLDAMVSSSTDLVIKNTSPYNVYINSFCDGEKLSMEVFGYNCGYKINLRSVVLKRLPCSEYEIIALDPIVDGVQTELVEGKRPIDGLVSESYRDYFSEKGLFFTERLRRSVYAPQKGIMYKKMIDD